MPIFLASNLRQITENSRSFSARLQRTTAPPPTHTPTTTHVPMSSECVVGSLTLFTNSLDDALGNRTRTKMAVLKITQTNAAHGLDENVLRTVLVICLHANDLQNNNILDIGIKLIQSSKVIVNNAQLLKTHWLIHNEVRIENNLAIVN